MTELENRPELQKRKMLLDWAGEFLKVMTLLLVLTCLIMLVIQGEVGKESRDQIISCTTPEGECSKRNAQKQAEVLAQIFDDGVNRERVTRETILAAASCAQTYTTFDAIKQCVENKVGDLDADG